MSSFPQAETSIFADNRTYDRRAGLPTRTAIGYLDLVDAQRRTGGTVATGDGITINPTGVEEFGTRLRAEVDKTIVPASDRIRQAMYAYPVFGQRSGSPAVQAAATRYYAQMRDAIA